MIGRPDIEKNTYIYGTKKGPERLKADKLSFLTEENTCNSKAPHHFTMKCFGFRKEEAGSQGTASTTLLHKKWELDKREDGWWGIISVE